MQKEFPALCTTLMVEALLDDRKTNTRRLSGLDYVNQNPDLWQLNSIWQNSKIDGLTAVFEERKPLLMQEVTRVNCPYGNPGDLIYVREAHYRYGKWLSNGMTKTGRTKWKFFPVPEFDAALFLDNPPDVIRKSTDRCVGWYKRSSLFLPKSLSRLWLQVEEVRIERLQDITEEDAKAEGVLLHERGKYYLNYRDQRNGLTQFIYNCHTASQSFRTLWDEINSYPNNWRENPWVWVVKFKVISKTGKPAGI